MEKEKPKTEISLQFILKGICFQEWHAPSAITCQQQERKVNWYLVKTLSRQKPGPGPYCHKKEPVRAPETRYFVWPGNWAVGKTFPRRSMFILLQNTVPRPRATPAIPTRGQKYIPRIVRGEGSPVSVVNILPDPATRLQPRLEGAMFLHICPRALSRQTNSPGGTGSYWVSSLTGATNWYPVLWFWLQLLESYPLTIQTWKLRNKAENPWKVFLQLCLQP